MLSPSYFPTLLAFQVPNVFWFIFVATVVFHAEDSATLQCSMQVFTQRITEEVAIPVAASDRSS